MVIEARDHAPPLSTGEDRCFRYPDHRWLSRL
jgi:hypothetical protein